MLIESRNLDEGGIALVALEIARNAMSGRLGRSFWSEVELSWLSFVVLAVAKVC
jgi:hypothetical protein